MQTFIIDEMEAQKQAEERRQFFAETLLPRTVAHPTYDYQGKNPCDKDTRIEALAEIMEWIAHSSRLSQNFLWLTGIPVVASLPSQHLLPETAKTTVLSWRSFSSTATTLKLPTQTRTSHPFLGSSQATR